MFNFLRTLFKTFLLSLLSVFTLAACLWFSGIWQDEPLSHESRQMLEMIDVASDVAAEENRFYHLTGFLSPPVFDPVVWAEMWWDEQKKFYENPENVSREFDFFRKREGAQIQNVSVLHTLKQAIEHYRSLLSETGNLFKQIDKPDFTKQLQEYYKGRKPNLTVGVDIQDMFVQRYKKIRQLQKNVPVVVKNMRATRPGGEVAVRNAHRLFLLDALNDYLSQPETAPRNGRIVQELLDDMLFLQQWLQNCAEFSEFIVVRQMTVEGMQAGLFVVEHADREGWRLSQREELLNRIIGAADLIGTYSPQQAIYREFQAHGLLLKLLAESPESYEVTVNPAALPSLGLLNGTGDELSWLVKLPLLLPKELYRMVMKFCLKPNQTMNLLAERYQVFLYMEPAAGISESLRKQVADLIHLSDTLYNRLYNPVGIYLFLGDNSPAGQSTPLPLFNIFIATGHFDEVQGLKEKAVALQ